MCRSGSLPLRRSFGGSGKRLQESFDGSSPRAASTRPPALQVGIPLSPRRQDSGLIEGSRYARSSTVSWACGRCDVWKHEDSQKLVHVCTINISIDTHSTAVCVTCKTGVVSVCVDLLCYRSASLALTQRHEQRPCHDCAAAVHNIVSSLLRETLLPKVLDRQVRVKSEHMGWV